MHLRPIADVSRSATITFWTKKLTMGCGSSAIMKKLPLEWKAQFAALKIYDADVEKFFKVYRQIDTDNSGAVNIDEMMIYFDIEPTNFCKRIFSVFDMNNSGKVDFREFVLSMWNYCSLSDATLG